MTPDIDILVVGAGPTGLTLALQAHDHGARVRIVERRPAMPRPSRALLVYPRTLEMLRPLGVTDTLLGRADPAPEGLLHLGRRLELLHLADFALDDCAFPALSLLRQADVEAVLTDALAERGVAVEWTTECTRVTDTDYAARAVLRSPAGSEEVACRFVAGCDGAASGLRSNAGIGWRGRTYAHEIVLADLELAGSLDPGVAHAFPGRRGLVFVFAIGERAPWRLLATRPATGKAPPFGHPGPPVPPGELQGLLDDAGAPAIIAEVAWSERIRVQCRLADRFRQGRLFLAGDAAHVSSPAAGQGMNTGIQDAANLGWKLAFAASAPAPAALLNSYERERRPVARRRLALTHGVFWAEASTGTIPSLLRARLAPAAAGALPLLLRRRRLVAEGVRLLSQLRVSYRRSALSVEGTPPARGWPRAGDRLPDASVSCCDQEGRLHQLLARPGVHVLLQRDATTDLDGALGPHVSVHRLTSMPGEGLIAIRPDGHVGFCCGLVDPAQLLAWLTQIGIAEPART